MKILIVSASFYPEVSPRSFRTTELVKELCRQKHSVTLVTTYQANDHDIFKKEYGIEIINLGKRKAGEISIAKSRYLNLVSRALRRLGLILFEYPDIELMFQVNKVLKNIGGFDLMISIAVPHPIHWGVAMAREKKHQIAKTWIADCGDPYMLISYDKFPKPFYFKHIEKNWCRKADYITVPIDGAIKGYYPEFIDKIRVIPQGFRFEDTQKLMKPYAQNDTPTFAYAGSFIPGRRDPRPIIEYLLTKNDPFKFYIFSNSLALVEPYQAKANGRLILSKYIPREQLITFLSSVDFVINIENGITEQIPSKLIDFYIINKPILSLNSNKIDFAKIDKFLAGDYSTQLYEENVDKYRIENVVKEFLSLT